MARPQVADGGTASNMEGKAKGTAIPLKALTDTVKQGVLHPANVIYIVCIQHLLLNHRKLLEPNTRRQR
jgi:hypothetical protein